MEVLITRAEQAKNCHEVTAFRTLKNALLDSITKSLFIIDFWSEKEYMSSTESFKMDGSVHLTLSQPSMFFQFDLMLLHH